MKNNLFPLALSLFLSASIYTFPSNAQEVEESEEAPEQLEREEIPSDRGISSPTQADLAAMQGMRVEEGLGESEPEGLTEGQTAYINEKAEEDEEIKKEKADADLSAADAQEIAATEEPFLAPNYEGLRGPIVSPVVDPVVTTEEP